MAERVFRPTQSFARIRGTRPGHESPSASPRARPAASDRYARRSGHFERYDLTLPRRARDARTFSPLGQGPFASRSAATHGSPDRPVTMRCPNRVSVYRSASIRRSLRVRAAAAATPRVSAFNCGQGTSVSLHLEYIRAPRVSRAPAPRDCECPRNTAVVPSLSLRTRQAPRVCTWLKVRRVSRNVPRICFRRLETECPAVLRARVPLAMSAD